MDRPRHPIRRFWEQLKRRRVLQPVIAYAAVAWLVIQIGETTFEPLNLPDIALTILVIVALAGLPVVAVLAWFLPSVREVPLPSEAASSPPAAVGREPSPLVLDNLPAPTTPLVGRERELREAERSLAEGCRILTITGPAGVGKTRLMLELGRRIAPGFRNGACFAPAGPLHAPEALPFLLAERLGVGFAPGENPWAATLAFLREKRILLLVDNFEQLAAAGGLLGEVARTAPDAVLVVTSRERLGLQGESTLRLEGLAVPPTDAPADPAGYDSVRLFVQSARRVHREFALEPWLEQDVARICRLVDGLPLALELAAGGVAVLSPGEIAREIEERHDVPLGSARDTPPRHRNLRAAFESSWTLLEPGERQAFRRLSVFHGGFGRAEAERVADADLRVLANLVNKSLLRRHESGRFDMLDIVRQLGEEKLESDPRESAAVRDLHAEHCVALLERLVRRWESGEAQAALAELAPDADNVRAAWSWMVRRRDAERLVRAADGLFRFWEARGWLHEGRELFHRAAGAAEAAAEADGSHRRLLGRLLAREGAFAELCDAHEEGGRLLERARSLLDPADDARDLAFTLCSLSFLARASGDFEAGRELAGEGLELYRSVDDVTGMATALNSLGAQVYMLGRYEEAKAHYRESIELFRRAGDSHGLWKPLNNLAGVAVAEKEYAEARRLLTETVEHQRRRQNRRGEATALENLGLVAWLAGDLDRAERLLEEVIGITEQHGYRGLLAHALNTLAAVRLDQGDAAGALAAYRNALDTACDAGDLPLALTVVLGIARVHARGGQREAALRMLHLVRTHPACDEDTRRDAADLLAELDGPELEMAGEPLDLDGIRDLASDLLVAAR